MKTLILLLNSVLIGTLIGIVLFGISVKKDSEGLEIKWGYAKYLDDKKQRGE